MMEWGNIKPENRIKALHRRLDDLLENPASKFIHFDIVEGFTFLGLTSYHYKGKLIKLNDSKDFRVIFEV